MIDKKIIIYIVVIIVVLIGVFLSQQAISREIGKNLVSGATAQASNFLAKGTSLAMPNIDSEVSKISEQLQNGGGVIQNTVEQTKEKISDAGKNIENYFTGIRDAVAGKNTNTCTATAPTTPTN